MNKKAITIALTILMALSPFDAQVEAKLFGRFRNRSNRSNSRACQGPECRTPAYSQPSYDSVVIPEATVTVQEETPKEIEAVLKPAVRTPRPFVSPEPKQFEPPVDFEQAQETTEVAQVVELKESLPEEQSIAPNSPINITIAEADIDINIFVSGGDVAFGEMIAKALAKSN